MSLTNDTCKNICNVGTTIGNVDYTLEQSMYFSYMSFGERLGLAHWGRGTVTIIYFFACSMPCCHLDQCGLLLIRILWTNSNEMIEMSYQKIHLKIWSQKWRPFCLSCSSMNKVTNTLVSPAWEMFSATSCVNVISIFVMNLSPTDNCTISQITWYFHVTWASYPIRKIVGCARTGNDGNVFPPPTSKEAAS